MGARFRLAAAAAGLVAVLALSEASRIALSRAGYPLDVDVGPSTGRYLTGFTESEERLPVTFRWTRESASLRVPLEAEGGNALLKIRYARFLEGNATVSLFLDGAPLGSFSARSGRFRTQEIPVSLERRPLRLMLQVSDPDTSRLGIAIDWIRIENARFRLPRTSMAPRLFLAGLFFLMLSLGFSITQTVLASGLAALCQASWFALSPFAMIHVHDEIAGSALFTAALLGLFFRSKAVPVLYLAGFVLKGGALFHPSYFYPDVRLHPRHLEVFEASKGGIVERGIAAQKAAQTAYPRTVAGKVYAFPYSPVFYIPFTLLDRDARGIEAAMKHVGLVLAALELPLVFLLARTLAGASVALWASILTVFLPPMVSRLLFAQWPTMAGHFFDVSAIYFAARMAGAAAGARPFVMYGVSGFLSCLAYVTSLVNLSLFSGFLALFDRRCRAKLLLLWPGIAAAVVLLLYRPFLHALFTEILPALARGEGSGSGNPAAGVWTALYRVHIFYGLGFPAMALLGFALVRRERETWAVRLLAAYGASFLALLALRAGSGMFKDLKEFVFVGPFVAVTTGVSLDMLWRRGPAGKAAAVFIAVGLVGFGLAKYAEYFRMHTALAGRLP